MSTQLQKNDAWPNNKQNGVTLIELIVFLIIIGVALSVVVSVFSNTIGAANDPLIRVRALELAQAQLDDVLARKFDENTPSGGVPACNSTSVGAATCLGIVSDADFDDVGDFDGFSSVKSNGYTVSVSVVLAGGDFGLSTSDAKRITVVVTTPATSKNTSGDSVTLAAYKVNF